MNANEIPAEIRDKIIADHYAKILAGRDADVLRRNIAKARKKRWKGKSAEERRRESANAVAAMNAARAKKRAENGRPQEDG